MLWFSYFTWSLLKMSLQPNQAPGVQDKTEIGSPTSLIVNKFHTKSDVDSSSFAQHHTIGNRTHQAASGAHTHDGKNSRTLLEGVSITGSRSGGAALDSVISALVKLGATDSTTA